jgi:hypothetical protein
VIVEQLIEHWPELALITVPTAHLAYVTQFEPARRKRHRERVITVVRIIAGPVRERIIVWRFTWELPDQPWWRRLLSRRHRDTTGG